MNTKKLDRGIKDMFAQWKPSPSYAAYKQPFKWDPETFEVTDANGKLVAIMGPKMREAAKKLRK